MHHRIRRAAILACAAALPLSLPGAGAQATPEIFVAYPAEGARVPFDHIILEGSVLPGAALTVDGRAVKVGPDGLFMEWWPLKPGVNDLRLVSTRAGRKSAQTLRVTRTVPRALPASPTFIEATSVTPRTDLEFWDSAADTPAERSVQVSFRGSPGGTARARVPGVVLIPLREGPAGTYSGTYTLNAGATLSATTLDVTLTGKDGRTVSARAPGRVSSLAPGQPGSGPRVAAQRPDTVQGWGLNEATWTLTTLDGEPLLYPRADMTFAAVGRVGDDLRVRLAPGLSALVTAEQVRLTPGPLPAASGGALKLDALSGPELALRVPLGGARLPFTVVQEDGGRRLSLTLYGALASPLILPAASDPLLRGVNVSAPAPGITRLTLDLTAPQSWGFTANYDGPDLLLSVRRPPTLNPARPLEGRVVTLDAGHGGTQLGGAGSLRVPEKDLTLPIALRAAELLRAQGAAVNLTRSADVTLGLYERGLSAETSGSDLLVSIHANALPDGRDPRGVRGPEVYFTHPQAQGVSAAILAQVRARLPELGPGRGLMPGANLALTRPSTQISLLVETAYLTDPGNLRVLMSEGGRERFAQAIAAGIADFYAAQR